MKRNYVGLASTLHDSALAIVNASGKVVFAEATERYLQNKRSINCAPDVIDRTAKLLDEYCDPDAELVIAQTWSEQTPQLMTRKLNELATNRGTLRKLMDGVPDFMRSHISSMEYLYASLLHVQKLTGSTLRYELNQAGRLGYIETLDTRKYDHHLTHAAAACYTSPYQEAVCVIIDGMGEDSSTAVYHYRDGALERLARPDNHSANSLGFFYTMLCVACGFGPLTGEEWKVMGLAPYGKPNSEYYQLLREFIYVDGLSLHAPSDTKLLSLSQKLHSLRRKEGESPWVAADLAYAGQRVFCDIYFGFLRNVRALGLSDNLVVGGGCALNSSANGHLLAETGFRSAHIFSAPGDDGNALGAALLAYYEDHPRERAVPATHSPYLGSRLSMDGLARVEKFGPEKCERLERGELCKRVARDLADGKIVAWAQGAAEFGPRALGNRSILADARDPQMKDRINARIKFREEFRPFAPSILDEHGPAYFMDYQQTPYMERTLRFRPEVADKVPAVVHEDGTGRLQSVVREWNPVYYQLIEEFYRLSGVPLLLNTSFNVMGKPIVHSVEDALAVFYTSGLDVLVMEDLYLAK